MDFQSTLFAPTTGDDAARGIDFAGIDRTELTRGAWVEIARAWLPDADDVFETLVREVPWRAERRQMYDRVVDVPRLVHTYMIGEELPHAGLTAARDVLTDHYAVQPLGADRLLAWAGGRTPSERAVPLVRRRDRGLARLPLHHSSVARLAGSIAGKSCLNCRRVDGRQRTVRLRTIRNRSGCFGGGDSACLHQA